MTAGFNADRLARLPEQLAGHVAQETVPGLVCAVSRHGELRLDAVGRLAFGSDRAMPVDAVFRIASLTKPVVAAGALLLVEDYLLRLDEPLNDLLPELADRRVLRSVASELNWTRRDCR